MRRKLEVKICGMRDSSNILEIASLLTDYMGFIFYPKSPRFVGTDFKVPVNFPKSVMRVGVFVNSSLTEIQTLSIKHDLDFIQLHGDESVDFVKELSSSGSKIFKAFALDDDFDFASIEPYTPFVHTFIFDTKGKLYGGNGTRFNWSLLTKYNGATRFLLSGGIQHAHIEEIKELKHQQLVGIDVNSGVESAAGIKDLEQTKKMLSLLKQIQ